MKIEAFPTFRLYTNDKKYAEFNRPKLNLNNMRKWLKANGAELETPDAKEEEHEKKEDAKEIEDLKKKSKE